jgi:cytochrome c biogenesis protein CcmG, thiol:disulfide interchange protein DsbE
MTESPPLDALAPQRSQREPRPRLTIVLGILVAITLVATAWYVGDRQGWNQIGQGGVNLRLLPKAGDPAPELVALAPNGEPVMLSQYRGRPVWLNFWGSWCPPCRSEMPEMQAAYEQLAPQGLVLLAVSLDESLEDAVSYAQLNGATYLVAADPYRKGSALYPIANFPTHILIDRDGIVRDIVLAELNAEQFVERAAVILKPSASG